MFLSLSYDESVLTPLIHAMWIGPIERIVNSERRNAGKRRRTKWLNKLQQSDRVGRGARLNSSKTLLIQSNFKCVAYSCWFRCIMDYQRKRVMRTMSLRNLKLLKMLFQLQRPPLWSSGQSSWLQIRRPGFDSRHYQKKSSVSGTGSTQPREYNWRATW
jgi:hypothetical protein